MAVSSSANPVRPELSLSDTWLLSRLSAYWLGWSPATFYRVYTIEAVVLFTLRWALYRMKRWHYYLFDFCYVANVLMLLHIWVWPHSAIMHKVTIVLLVSSIQGFPYYAPASRVCLKFVTVM